MYPAFIMAPRTCSLFARIRDTSGDPHCHMDIRASAATATSPSRGCLIAVQYDMYSLPNNKGLYHSAPIRNAATAAATMAR
jgi:hypothetical protein